MSARAEEGIVEGSGRFRSASAAGAPSASATAIHPLLRRKPAQRHVEWGVARVLTRGLLDRVQAHFEQRPHDAGAAMFDLQSGLREVKSACGAGEWDDVVAECEAHPVRHLLWQDPFTRHSYEKPCGYAGDAQLLDYLYGVAGPPLGTTPLGASVFGHMMAQAGAHGVRARAEVLAGAIDAAAEKSPAPRILSIACGHLREGARSAALMDGRVSELVALDQDAGSLAEVERAYAGKRVRTVNCSVRAVLAGKVRFEGYHLVYAAGLYDYLSERVAARLTRLMFDMLAPGGRLLVANFAPGLPEVGYMETFMGWKLIYRTPAEMGRLSADIPGSGWASNSLSWDSSGTVIFLDVVKRLACGAGVLHGVDHSAAAASSGIGVAVTGLGRVTFGPAVAPARATGVAGPL